MKKIKLTQAQEALVDNQDFEQFGNLKWYAFWNKCTKSFYAARESTLTKKTIFLHREIMGNPIGKKVDHKNHDTLDCRKDNLRVCTPSQNAMNRNGPTRRSTSGLRGVCWRKDICKWQSHIGIKGKKLHLGFFSNKNDAAEAYAVANRRYFGEFGGGL